MAQATKESITLFGTQEQVEYYTSRAWDFQGCPLTWKNSMLKVGIKDLLKNPTYLWFAIRSYTLFKPLRTITLYFPYEHVPEPFISGLTGILWKIETIQVNTEN